MNKNSFSRKASIIILSILMMISMFPMYAFADVELQTASQDSVTYRDADGNEYTQDNVNVLTSADSGITELVEGTNDGWYSVRGDVTISNKAYNTLTCNGDIKLILEDGASLTVKASPYDSYDYNLYGTAVRVPYENSLTIYGQSEGSGKLSCYGAKEYGSGIGASLYDSGMGDLTINGGEVEAVGCQDMYDRYGCYCSGTGIGSMFGYYTGTIAINAGKLTAVGGPYCPAIYYGEVRLNSSDLRINGGDVYLKAGEGSDSAIYWHNTIIKEEMAALISSEDALSFVDHNNNDDIISSLHGHTQVRFAKGVRYVDESNAAHTVLASEVTSDTYTLDASIEESYGGYYYVKDDTDIFGLVKIIGDVKLIVRGNKTLETDGICVEKGNSLTTYSDAVGVGTIKAIGSSGCAGIGSEKDVASGMITLNNCNVIATGSGGTVGIGGGGANDLITINSGMISATGGNGAAGIGGFGNKSSGLISIVDGTVTAIGGSNGAGIGGFGTSSVATINISGGIVDAQGKGQGAGIGGNSDAISINISGGQISAIGDVSSSSSGAGIGGNYKVGNGPISISSGQISATGGKYGAGIGTGNTANPVNLVGKQILITSGIIDAIGGTEAAGIGGGRYGASADIVIDGGTVNATGNSSGAGIGSGSSNSKSNITINGGVVTAISNGTNGSGIGGGFNSGYETIKLNGGTIKASGSVSGVGSGAYGSSDAGIISADAGEIIWAAENAIESKNRSAQIDNDGGNLSSLLSGKDYVYANHALNSEGVSIDAYVGTKVPIKDRDKLYENLDQISITSTDAFARKDAQFYIMSKLLEEEMPDEEARLDYINDVLRAEDADVRVGTIIEVKVKNSNLSGGDDAFIEYELSPSAYVEGLGDIRRECKLTKEDFKANPCSMEVTIPTCGSFDPGKVLHTNDDGSVVYEIFTENGLGKKFNFSKENNTIKVSIEHCSNLTVLAKPSVNTGDDTNTNTIICLAILMLLSVCGAAYVAIRRKRA